MQQEINALDAELVQLLINMDILSDELAAKEVEIDQANKDLEAAKKEEREQYEQMKKRIRAMYIRGDGSLLEALLGATSMSDFLNRVNYYNAVHDYDRNQLEVYKETKQQVIDLKSQLLSEQSEMEEMQDNYRLQEDELKAMVSQKKLRWMILIPSFPRHRHWPQPTRKRSKSKTRSSVMKKKRNVLPQKPRNAQDRLRKLPSALQEKPLPLLREKRRNALPLLKEKRSRHSSPHHREAVLPAARPPAVLLRVAAPARILLLQSARLERPEATSSTTRRSLSVIRMYGEAPA